MQQLNTQNWQIFNTFKKYHYSLPSEQIAQQPIPRRTQARLLVMNKKNKILIHTKIAQLSQILNKGDLLVINNSKVIPSKIWTRKLNGERIEFLLLNPAYPESKQKEGELHWAIILHYRHPLKIGQKLFLENNNSIELEIIKQGEKGQVLIWLTGEALKLTSTYGEISLPPYIKRKKGVNKTDRIRYQTVYATNDGAVAAPTAGLHFSHELLIKLIRKGIKITSLTLHVSYMSFTKLFITNFITKGIHSEWVEISDPASKIITQCRQQGNRIIAVGTTSLRALEWRTDNNGLTHPGAGWCKLLISPGFNFQILDGLITNFHLPRTTLLMLVAAITGRERILKTYAEAITIGYRFYSFGDAMLIL